MTRYGFILGFLLFAGSVLGYEDLPVPQTTATLEFVLPSPYKQGIVKATAAYDRTEDVTVLKSLIIKIDSQKTSIPAQVLRLFEGPRLDTLRLFVCPEIMLEPDEYPPKDQIYFAVTFRFLARASEGGSLENRPTAWIAVKNGEIRNISEIRDIRKGTVPSKEYDPKTLKPIEHK